MSRLVRFTVAMFVCLAACAATLERLSLDQMSQSATAVVRARVAGSYTSITNSTIYTHYKLQVADVWKGSAPSEVMVPGGVANGLRQSFPGVPELSSGAEYVLFLWTSQTTGITHILGLTQGLFNVRRESDGSAVAWRAKIGETMLDASGHKVTDQAVMMNLIDLKAHVGQSKGLTQ